MDMFGRISTATNCKFPFKQDPKLQKKSNIDSSNTKYDTYNKMIMRLEVINKQNRAKEMHEHE